MTYSDAEERLRAFAAVADTTIGHLDVDDLLGELLGRVAELVSADTAAVLLLDQQSGQLVARAAHGIEEEVRQGVRVPLGVGFAGRIAANREPVRLDRVDDTTVWNPILWQKGIRRMLGVPLVAGRHLLGVIHVGRVADDDFTEDDVQLLEMVAVRVAAAIQARELEVERAAGRVVQRSLLPSALPSPAGVRFAGRYVPAEDGRVGGDWYDVFIPPSGELWVMAGDVAGHGLHAAITMSRLRAALRAYALDGHGPGRVLKLADRKFQFFDPGQMATVVCARLSPSFDTVELAAAGHLPPVFAAEDGPARLLDIPVSPPLGVADLEPAQITMSLPVGAVLLMYTDGLVERRGESIDRGLSNLTSVVTAQDPESVCRTVMASLIGAERPTDDIALLVLQRVVADEPATSELE